MSSAWPGKTDSLWPSPMGTGYWLRAQPVDGGSKGPRLQMAGSAVFSTQPDGLWVFLWPDGPFADAVAIEVCGSLQNLNDKRSRYMPSVTARELHCTRAWLLAEISWKAGKQVPRWQAADTWGDRPAPVEDVVLPIRFMRVIYFVPDDDYGLVGRNIVPHGHEFFSRHSSLATTTAPQMRAFLQRATLGTHFYPLP